MLPVNPSPSSACDPILAAALDAVVTADAGGRLVDLNPAAERMLGCTRAEALGQRVAELLIPEELRAAHLAGLARVVAGADSKILGRRVEFTACRTDGTRFPVELTVTRTSEDPPMFSAWMRDLTERKAAEAESARRRALLERAEEIAESGSWEWTPGRQDLLWTDNLSRIFGLEPGDHEPTLEFLLDRTHPADRARLRRAIAKAAERGVLSPIEMRIVRPDGEVRHIRAGGAVEAPEGDPPRPLIGIVHDVTARCRAERSIAARAAVSEALSAWESLEPGAERLLGAIARAVDACAGGLWLPEGDVLVARSWWSDEAIVPEFEEATRKLRLPRGVGLPGRAWERREPVNLRGLLTEEAYHRREIAEACGIRGGLAFPAVVGDEVLAVIELYMHTEASLTDGSLRSIRGIGHELGAFLARRRGHLGPCPLTPRELEVLQLAAQGFSGRRIAEDLYVSPATVKTHLEHIYSKLGVADRASAVAHALRAGLIH
jgi:PAS domain S-box-containing protein